MSISKGFRQLDDLIVSVHRDSALREITELFEICERFRKGYYAVQNEVDFLKERVKLLEAQNELLRRAVPGRCPAAAACLPSVLSAEESDSELSEM